jgi:Skp family chaperone for outer membrane proteins
MKYRFQHTSIIIASILFSLVVSGQRGTKVGYIDMAFILETVDEYNKASNLLDKNIENWKKEIELKKLELEQIQDQLDAERIIFTPELINDREMEIQDFASEIIRLQEKRFGPSGDMIIQRSKLMQPLQDQVMTIVKQVAEENKYDFIFDRSSTATMLYSAKNYDISDLVIKRINRQQKNSKKKRSNRSFKIKSIQLKKLISKNL